jgi:small subunit ribosomal protein S36
MATVLRVERAIAGGPASTDRELALLRLANAAVVAPLPLLAWWAARRFGHDHRTGVVAAISLLAVPMLTHIGSTLNNDNLLTLLGAVLVALLAGVLRGDRSVRTAVLVGAVVALALLTKAFAAVFPPIVALAYLVGATADDEQGVVGAPSPRGRSPGAPCSSVPAGGTSACASGPGRSPPASRAGASPPTCSHRASRPTSAASWASSVRC